MQDSNKSTQQLTGDLLKPVTKNYQKLTHYYECQDKLLHKLLYRLLKPTFKHIISSHCVHLQGPSVIPTVICDIHQALTTTPYRYVIRTDVKSYYASIDHAILIQHVQACFNDARVRLYLSQIIQAPIDHGGVFEHPTQGIWPQSSLSGLFAALYLKPLDQVFDRRTDLFYRRYNDDIVILCRTKSQWAKAKRRLKEVMDQLNSSRTKTYMGPLAHGFHFRGSTSFGREPRS